MKENFLYSLSEDKQQQKYEEQQHGKPLDGVWVFGKFAAANGAGFAFCIYLHRA